ncbi:MAG: glycosyltransferase [Flavobacteriaceae bacterium]|nr:glycosyltransferase [Flavobacteriaceae bacterium]
MRNKVIALVSNNIANDQRLIKVGNTLQRHGYEFLLIGTAHRGLPQLDHISFPTQRLPIRFQKNFLFYAELQFRHLLHLVQKNKKDAIILANDLDTLLPAKIISNLYKIPLVVDFHEIFSEMPTLIEGTIQKNTWKWLEKQLLPSLKHTYTISESYADFFRNNYKIQPEVIMNVPLLGSVKSSSSAHNYSEKIILYQGAMNYSRGIDKMILAMKHLENTVLWLIGNGPCLAEFQALSQAENLQKKVIFLGLKSPEELKKISPLADLGLSLEEDKGLSYRFALPNKIFDYLHAEIPVLGSSDLIEVKKIIENYQVGDVIVHHHPEHIALKISKLLKKDKSEFSVGLQKAKLEFNWEKQEEKLLNIYHNAAHE